MHDRPPLLALEHFVATATLGTVRAAADRLNVTPSAVSHQIGRLESFLQVKLFHRYRQRLILTEPGRQFLERLETPLDLISEATRDAARHDKRRRLRVSVAPTMLCFWMLPRLQLLKARAPELTLSFVDSLTYDPMEAEVDCAIEYRIQPDDRLRSTKLFDDEVVTVCSPEYKARMGLNSLEDVRGCMLIETERRAYSWASLLRKFPWRNQCDMVTVQATYQAVTSVAIGHGIAIANRHNVEYLLNQQRLVIPFEIEHDFHLISAYYFSCTPKKESLPAVQAFRDWLLEEVAASCGGGKAPASLAAPVRSRPARQGDRRG